MYRLFFVAKNNLKKQKGDMITLLILSFLTAFLMFSSLSVLTGIDHVMDDALERVNGPYIFICNGDSETETRAAEEVLKNDERILDYERTEILNLTADYKNGKDSEWTNYSFVLGNYNVETRINDMHFSSGISGNDILLPYHMKGSFKEGDTFQLRFGETIYDFRVAGYVEDPYFCTLMNITIIYAYVSEDMYSTLKQNETLSVMNMHKGTSDESFYDSDFTTAELEKEITDRYKELITDSLAEHPEYTSFLAANWHMMRGGSSFTTQIVMAVVLLFAVILLVVAVSIISFSIRNFIRRNMKNTGILEASGYTVRELRGILLTETALASGTGILAGILMGILGGKAIGNIAGTMMGLRWNRPVNIPLALVVGFSLLLLVLLVTYAVSRRYKKITVLDALRGGISNHNFKKNRFSFEKTHLPTPLVLSLKDTFGNLGRNIALAFIMALLAIFMVAGFGLWLNFGRDGEKIMDIMGFETCTCSVGAEAGLMEKFEQLEGVESVMAVVGFEPAVTNAKGKQKTAFAYVYDDNHKRKNLILLEGRIPEHDNELMITPGLADDLSVGVGDVLTVSYGGNSADFIITGMDQKVERMGRTLSLTAEGFKKIVPGDIDPEYYISGAAGVSYDTLSKEVKELEKELQPEKSWVLSNMKEFADQTTSVVTGAMKAICLVILLVTFLVVLFVESLLIRSKVIQEWRNMGVSRALGMSSGELKRQIICSNLPSVAAGALIGAILGGFVAKKGVLAAFSIFGLKDIAFTVDFPWLLITVAGIALVAALAAWLSGRRLRTMNPVELITEE